MNFPSTFIKHALFIISLLSLNHVCAADQWSEHFQKLQYGAPEKFVVQGVQKIPGNGFGKTAIDLGSGIGQESRFLLQKGYRVIAVDENPRALSDMRRLPGIGNTPNLKTINAKFEKLNFKALPRADLVVSSFAIPFVHQRNFARVWQDVVSSIKPGGHIVINLFDSRLSFYNKKQQMTFHTKQQALALFSNFKIIEFREVRNDALKPGQGNHYYVVVAKKLP